MDLTEKKISIFSLPVIVAALGYFVDIYDLLLFTIVKKTSMLGVGSTEATLLVDSTRVINWQMTGLLLGGIIWGVLADKKGRLSVLFGSIILYSTANFATGFVTTVDQYAWARFIGGLGLAGELGAGITLVSELLPKNKRGVGTSLVAGIGLFGAVAAYYTYQYTQDWRLCYKIGGVLGICLLLLRVKVAESGMFATAKASEVVKGNFFMLINNGKRFKKYFVAILIGLPTWYVIGILLNQSDRFGKAMFNSTTIDSGRAIMFGYVGIAIGDILIGLVSQYFKSRKKALLLFYGLTMLGLLFYYSNYNNSDTTMYLVAGWLGFSTGFWAIFVTMGAEQFGTNLRATAATTIPNMVRGALPLMNMLFLDLFQKSWHWSIVYSGIITGIIVMCVAFTAYAFTEETFHKDLDYMELD
ncbi:MAG: MFS transporter [Sediminibacterium sp.]|jgi:MFS family permease|nr:MFS transporter [Sediminibacterium sp.]